MKLLFVCIENSNRSQMAEAFARRHGGDAVDVNSAGSRPSGQVNPRAILFMHERGYDLTTHTSKSLTALPATTFDAVITMGCGDACPNVPALLHEDWAIPDPKYLPDDQFREIRDLIESKVLNLLHQLGVVTEHRTNESTPTNAARPTRLP
jgi:protein-tyrosine-phosphatase